MSFSVGKEISEYGKIIGLFNDNKITAKNSVLRCIQQSYYELPPNKRDKFIKGISKAFIIGIVKQLEKSKSKK